MNAAGTGCYGKVPSRGDFVHRRLTRDIVDPFDAWLQRAITASREALGADWLDAYLAAPIWRFALSPHVCGPATVAGVVMPSVDRVGRYYPMMLARPFPDWPGPASVAAAAEPWFARLDALALSCLEDGFDLDAFDAALEDASPGPGPGAGEAPLPDEPVAAALGAAGLDVGSAAALLDGVLRQGARAASLWWTTGSEQVAASIALHDGLPAPDGFARFLAAPPAMTVAPVR